MPSSSSNKPLRILLVNDDGPPSHPSSPHIYGLYRTLRSRGHDVSVVLPSHQKSWGAMAFSIAGEVGVWWWYPDGKDEDYGYGGTWETQRRQGDNGDEGWVLIDGSPTTCTNVGLFNQALLNPSSSTNASKPFDLVLSGPNFGRNTGAAFCMSSGTLGAAMAAALSDVRAIALSYGHFQVVPPAVQKQIDEKGLMVVPSDPAQKTGLEQEKKEKDEQQSSSSSSSARKTVAPRELVQIAHELSVDIIERLYAGWDSSVAVYNVNVPLVWTLKDPQIYWTTIWQNRYPQLFKQSQQQQQQQQQQSPSYSPADAPTPQLELSFQPEMSSMMTRGRDEDMVGTDTWALTNGHISISRLRPGFTEVPLPQEVGENAKAGGSVVVPGGSRSVGLEAKRWRL